MTRINVAEVTSVHHRYTKARALLEEGVDGAKDKLIVTDRTGKILAEELGRIAPRGDGNYDFYDQSDFPWEILQLSGCGCGGTRVEEL